MPLRPRKGQAAIAAASATPRRSPKDRGSLRDLAESPQDHSNPQVKVWGRAKVDVQSINILPTQMLSF